MLDVCLSRYLSGLSVRTRENRRAVFPDSYFSTISFRFCCSQILKAWFAHLYNSGSVPVQAHPLQFSANICSKVLCSLIFLDS